MSTPANDSRGQPGSQCRVRPTKAFGVFFAVLCGFLYAAVSQQNAVAYLFFFFLSSAGLVSAPIGYRNLRWLHVRSGSSVEGFASEPLAVRLAVENSGQVDAWGVRLSAVASALPQSGFSEVEVGEVAPKGLIMVELSVRASRGLHPVNAFVLRSEFPLGLWRWERRIPTSTVLVVYPERKGDLPLPLSEATSLETGQVARSLAGDDFRGWRKQLPGDSSRHIDWKAVARGHPPMVKEFESEAGGTVELRYDEIEDAEMESRLSQLAQWVWACGEGGTPYTLVLPGMPEVTGAVRDRDRQALRALAAFPNSWGGQGA